MNDEQIIRSAWAQMSRDERRDWFWRIELAILLAEKNKEEQAKRFRRALAIVMLFILLFSAAIASGRAVDASGGVHVEQPCAAPRSGAGTPTACSIGQPHVEASEVGR